VHRQCGHGRGEQLHARKDMIALYWEVSDDRSSNGVAPTIVATEWH
jgi:hypothetical protein